MGFKKIAERPKDAYKGTFGKVLVFAGSENFPGAAYLACAATYRVGAGLVTLATLPSVKTIISSRLPEVTFILPDEIFENLEKYDVFLLGPGLGQNKKTVNLIKKILKRKKLPSLVVDADALNIISNIKKWWDKIQDNFIITPHIGEMARLTKLTLKEIQLDRLKVAKAHAKKWKKTIVLKGANTVIVSPASEVMISPFANPVLATAGTGDVLSGIISGLLAQGLKIFEAASAGVYIHGLTGEKIGEQIGDTGMLASDLLKIIPIVINELRTTEQIQT